jgi:hypothetical protein
MLRSYGDRRAEVFVHDHRGKLRRIGQMGRPIGWSEVFRGARPTHETVIRLSDREPPPMSSPSGVERWFSTDQGPGTTDGPRTKDGPRTRH